MSRIASVNDPGSEYQKYIRVEAGSEAEALSLAESEASRRGWNILRTKQSPIGQFHFLCGTHSTTKPYPPGF